jgi:preprotein translocase subunit SecB
MEPVLFIEGPRLLFPFARAIISDLTRDGGYTPLMLNPIDFVDLYRRKLAERQGLGDPALQNNLPN